MSSDDDPRLWCLGCRQMYDFKSGGLDNCSKCDTDIMGRQLCGNCARECSLCVSCKENLDVIPACKHCGKRISVFWAKSSLVPCHHKPSVLILPGCSQCTKTHLCETCAVLQPDGSYLDVYCHEHQVQQPPSQENPKSDNLCRCNVL